MAQARSASTGVPSGKPEEPAPKFERSVFLDDELLLLDAPVRVRLVDLDALDLVLRPVVTLVAVGVGPHDPPVLADRVVRLVVPDAAVQSVSYTRSLRMTYCGLSCRLLPYGSTSTIRPSSPTLSRNACRLARKGEVINLPSPRSSVSVVLKGLGRRSPSRITSALDPN